MHQAGVRVGGGTPTHWLTSQALLSREVDATLHPEAFKNALKLNNIAHKLLLGLQMQITLTFSRKYENGSQEFTAEIKLARFTLRRGLTLTNVLKRPHRII